MKVLANTGGIVRTNCYVVADETTRQAVLFDAPDHTVNAILDEAERFGWDVVGLWLTHGHFDHVADHAVFSARFPKAQVLIHPLDELKLQRPELTPFPLPFIIPPRNADSFLQDDQILTIGSLKVKVLHTPGHSPGHVSFYFPDESLLIGGDLLILGSVGRTDLPDANDKDLERSLLKIATLPPKTQLLPGHGPPSTLANELSSNHFFAQVVHRRHL